MCFRLSLVSILFSGSSLHLMNFWRKFFSPSICLATMDFVRHVWMMLSLHFCLCGREIQVQMRKSDIVFGTEEDGDTIISLASDFLSKNHQGGLDGSAFSSAGVIRDKMQVSAIQRYIPIPSSP